MKKRNVLKRSTTFALTAAMALQAVTMAGCGSNAASGQSAKNSNSDAPIKLTVYSQLANYSGIQTGWSAKILKDKFNVELNIIPESDGVFETRMESGDLGDIVIWGDDTDHYHQAIDAGLLYDWNEDDLLADYGPYIKENMSKALDKNAGLSDDKTVYGFGHDVAATQSEHSSFFYTWDIRWDLYKQLGYPEVKDMDDLVELFKQMQEICPTDDNGNKAYAASLWPDWDGDMVMYVKSFATGYYGYDELGTGLYDTKTGEYHDELEENGPYLTSLKFFNKLYQNGLLDPDSMTATYDTMLEKVQKGGTFFSIFNYAGSLAYNTDAHTSEGKMLASLVPEEASPIVYGMNIQGGNRVWSIGANCEYPEVCMEIINYLSTPEGRVTCEYGPKGVTWDYDDEGNTYFTDLGKACHSDTNTEMEGDYTGTFADGQFKMGNTTWAIDCENPESNGEKYNCDFWKSNQTEAGSDIEKDWREVTGFNSTQDYLNSTNYTIAPGTSYSASVKSDELQNTWEQVKTCVVEGSWNAIYADTDEEFDKIVADMRTQAESYGYADCVEWSKNEAATRHALELEVGSLK